MLPGRRATRGKLLLGGRRVSGRTHAGSGGQVVREEDRKGRQIVRRRKKKKQKKGGWQIKERGSPNRGTQTMGKGCTWTKRAKCPNSGRKRNGSALTLIRKLTTRKEGGGWGKKKPEWKGSIWRFCSFRKAEVDISARRRRKKK